MKYFSKFIYSLVAGALCVTACDMVQIGDSQMPHRAGEADVEGCLGVYFPETPNVGTFTPEAEKKVTITVARTVDTEDATVPVKITADPAKYFSVTDAVFKADQKETVITFSFAEDTPVGTSFPITLSVEGDQYVSKYSSYPSACSFSVLIDKWTEMGKALYTEDLVTACFGVSNLTYEVTVEKNDITEGLYRLVNPYDGKYPYNDPGDWDPDNNYYLIINATDPDNVYIPRCDLGFDWSYGMFYAISYGAYYMANGKTLEEAKKLCEFGKMKNGVITFPTKGILFGLPSEGLYYGNSNGKFKVILPGGKDVDYSLKLEADVCADAKVPVFLAAGKDIENVKYVVTAGTLEAADAKKVAGTIINGTAEGVQTLDLSTTEPNPEDGLKYEMIEISELATGAYTLVAVPYGLNDAGTELEAKTQQFVNFQFVAKEDEEQSAVVINTTLEETPSRFTDYDKYSSLAAAIWGSEITDAHFGLFKTADFEKSPSDFLDEVKYNTDKYGLSANQIALINAGGGLYVILQDLLDGTGYTLVVWATNGKLDKFVTSSCATELSPEVWKSLGETIWSEELIGVCLGLTNSTFSAEVLASETKPGRYKFPNLYKPFASPLGIWDPSGAPHDLIVDATNPEKVTIKAMDPGLVIASTTIVGGMEYYLSAGYSESVIISALGDLYGKKNGNVITFPKEGIYFLVEGSIYNFCADGFTITIPETQSSSSEKVVPSFGKVDAGHLDFSVKMPVSNVLSARKNCNFKAVTPEIRFVEFKAVSRQAQKPVKTFSREFKQGTKAF